ncbi:transporter substrate-binding domain-containing protein [Vallitalea pronyensis]|uniref:Transporter substrate-binding domain-containing protein n=1 Tax=Vallitalea pronyensis TaxID=1348613 RepID=A0A8J8MM24_9FIRM|nr:transporter substrate-binding domain-containing protein [Vallitalea pronyensis]QUI23991.1 transporter substrate-binding domain-containing protein [Vallitalea pronyensis]
MKKLLVIISIGLLTSMLLIGCSSKKTDTAEEDTLIVGMELAYPPFETKDDEGNPMGVSVDLAKALGEHLERPVKIENTNWDGLIPSLQTGKIDVVISSMTITDERSKIVDFSDAYARSYLALLVNNKSGVKSMEDLNQKDKVIAVKKGTTGYIYANKHLEQATVNGFSSENACVTEVIQGKADAFIYDQLTIYRQNQQNSDTTEAILIPFQDSEGWGMAVKKDNEALLSSINTFIAEYKSDGGFDELTDRYMKEEKETFDALGFPWFFD